MADEDDSRSALKYLEEVPSNEVSAERYESAADRELYRLAVAPPPPP